MNVEESAEYQVELPEFEGPLDLLLHLVKRHELSIIDIPISFVTEKYIEYLDLMQALNLDVAGEYLLMAATLAQIKSRELLPQKEVEEEEFEEDEGDPRSDLIRRLLEYQRYKEVAVELAERPAFGRQIFGRGAEMEKVDPSEVPLAEVSSFALISALADLIKRKKIKMAYDVVIDRISITDRINQIVDQLARKETVRFLDCFEANVSNRHDLVVTFLAVLELARLRMIRLTQTDASAEIFVTRTTQLRAIDSAESSFA